MYKPTTASNKRRGAPVIGIADALHSHLSATLGKEDDQGMKWNAPKRATTQIIVQVDGRRIS